MKLKTLFVLAGMFTSIFCKAQNRYTIPEINENKKRLESRGMLVLGSWALGNMVWGGIGASRSGGSEKGFHQMNLYWNSVNLAIAGLGYFNARGQETNKSLWKSLEAQHKTEKILLFNAALDLGYMAGGLYLKERGRARQKEQWIGFGNSIVLQGAFLLVFDGILYSLQAKNRASFKPWMDKVNIGASGVSFRVGF
ncbi:hypothetical protein SAMN04488057_11651 [Cyclobacterium lianum]|uniref:DUF5683 domain-containing protein n=1 Tax=Cyclobacterium lianum TaxID=388280 RepID=A0A1M7QC42_9BACT|nr:hypothetical protein [Cyclobacterium lianum]SHN28352.1 hypothetical protein SAMN04488057_11651 [Cyclobacterium lianum]